MHCKYEMAAMRSRKKWLLLRMRLAYSKLRYQKYHVLKNEWFPIWRKINSNHWKNARILEFGQFWHLDFNSMQPISIQEWSSWFDPSIVMGFMWWEETFNKACIWKQSLLSFVGWCKLCYDNFLQTDAQLSYWLPHCRRVLCFVTGGRTVVHTW